MDSEASSSAAFVLSALPLRQQWAWLAEGWLFPLSVFLGKKNSADLPVFDPFDRLLRQFQWHSCDRLQQRVLLAQPEFTLTTVKSKQAWERETVVLLHHEQRVGFVYRHPEGCDTLSLLPAVRGLGLCAPLILGAMQLRAQLRYQALSDGAQALRSLFNGGSYTVAGLAAVKAAHRHAVEKAYVDGRPIPACVLHDYPQLRQAACA